MKAVNTLLAIMVLALSATQLSCSVNDYCLNCATDDGGTGDDDANDADMPVDDAPPDAGCMPTGPEVCDDVDNDCNGLKDDGNVENVGNPCDEQEGVCQGGTKICVAGVMDCTKKPSPEICDNLDNNCNNVVDEGDPGGGGICGTEQGECQAGTLRCAATASCLTAASCNPLTQNCCVKCQTAGGAPWVGSPQDDRLVPETCNAKDDNCNGSFDEGLSSLGACGPTTGDGVCVIGTKACVGGREQCNGAVFPGFEICNGLDDDCDETQVGGGIDESFNLNIDPQNCGACTTTGNNRVCAPTQKTCINSTIFLENRTTCVDSTDCAGSGTCVVNSQPCCGPGCAPSKPSIANGTCSFECNVGFIDLNGTAADGCEYKCSPTGAEECDGIDNDCDGTPDDGLTAPVGLCLTQGVCAGTSPVCENAGGWDCNYPLTYENSGEVSCDGLNNDCDSNIDESHLQKYQTCADNPAAPAELGICRDQGVFQCDTADPDGPLVCLSGENGAQCANSTDDNGNGFINEGCPAVGPPESGTECNSGNTTNEDSDGPTAINDGCPAQPLPSTPPAVGGETCNAKDDDCDGDTDEDSNGVANGASPNGVLAGLDWVSLANGVRMMKYEASRPDATGAFSGLGSSMVCSRSGALPWTNVTYPQAQTACAAVGARLCTESEWHHACSGVPTPTTLVSGAVIEAEDYTGIDYGTVPAAAESGNDCLANTAADNDLDGTVNDGCPAAGPSLTPETLCSDNADNDGDTFINDGCPTIAAQTRAWVHDYTTGFSGISAMEALLNTTGGGVSIATATAQPSQSPRLSYTLGVTAATYRVWVKMYQTGFSITGNGDNNLVYVQLDTGALFDVALPDPTPCTTNSECTFLTGGTCADLDNGPAQNFCAGWQWVEKAATTYTLTAGQHTLKVYMGDDGVKFDKVALNTGPAPVDTALAKGRTYAYGTPIDPMTPNNATCNGHEQSPLNDNILTAGFLTSCFADQCVANLDDDLDGRINDGCRAVGAAETICGPDAVDNDVDGVVNDGCAAFGTGETGAFDMSGNVKEWTAAQQPGVNPLRGGASNSTTVGTSCALNFTVADDALQFPNIGFRCCK